MRIGLLWRAEWDSAVSVDACRLRGVFAAFTTLGIDALPVVYSDEAAVAVAAKLAALDGVLVWVNPIEHGLDRSTLDPLLREAAAAGVFVSAHPDVILKMGTKDVLVTTRSLSWGTDTFAAATVDELERELRARLECGPLVVKQHRGMGGLGVWKVELAGDATVLVQEAARGAPPEELPLAAFLGRCAGCLGSGPLVGQPYQPRIADGMIRAYLTHDHVVGFAHQYPRGLLPPGADAGPTGKVFDPPDDARYALLRERLEEEWVAQMQEILDLEPRDLPVIWDADFLLGEDDRYVLCEINVSSTFAFPEFAMDGVARATLAACQ